MNEQLDTSFVAQLETNKVLPVIKTENEIQDIIQCDSSVNQVHQLQFYNPLYDVLNDVSCNLQHKSLNHKFHLHSENKVYILSEGVEITLEKPVFI